MSASVLSPRDRPTGEWLVQNGVEEEVTSPRSRVKESDSEFIKMCKGGGHKDLLEDRVHTPTQSPVKVKKDGGDWYGHDGVDVKETHKAKGMTTTDTPRSPESNLDINLNTEYIQTARKGGSHKDLLETKVHTPSAAPVQVRKDGGDWYGHKGTDVKDTHQRKEMATINSPQSPNDSAVDINLNTEYIKMAKKGGGHNDMLKIKHHERTPSPMKVDKKDGKWYYHDGVSAKDTHQRKDEYISSPRSPTSPEPDLSESQYLKTAKKGGSHRDLLTVTPHKRTETPKQYDKKCNDWYYHKGVNVKESLQKKDESVAVTPGTPRSREQTAYLKMAKKGGRSDLLSMSPTDPAPSPRRAKESHNWYYHDGVDAKDSQQRKETRLHSNPSTLKFHTVDSGKVRRHSHEARLQNRNKAGTEYLRTAKQGGHRDLLSMEEPIERPRTAFGRSATTPQSNGLARPRTANPYMSSPFALHVDAPGSGRNPDKI